MSKLITDLFQQASGSVGRASPTGKSYGILKKPQDTDVLFRILYGDFRTRYTILAPKEAVAAMKKVKRPVTEEKKNIAATHAVMDKVNLIGDKFQVLFVKQQTKSFQT